MQFKQKMSNIPNSIHFSQLEQQLKLAERSKKDLIEFLNVSKGKILTLIKTVFSFISDKSLLKKESLSSFNKYTIESKLVQTMSKVYDFYISNFPENGRETLHELIKERYLKFIKFFEQNENCFFNTKELLFKFYLIQGMLLLWLIEIKYDTEYYDEIIRVINGLIQLDSNTNDNIININEINTTNTNEKNNYLIEFLNTVLKFPYIKQNKEIIIHALEVNECSEFLINLFNEKIQNLIKKKNSEIKPDINSIEFEKENNFGKKSISSVKEESYFSLIKQDKKEKQKEQEQEKISASSSISNKHKSINSISSHKSVLSSINSSGFYTPEFKHAKRDSIRHYRRFTINNINNPKTSIQTKNNTLSRSLSSGMTNLLNKCEQGINHNKNNNNININNNNTIQNITNGPSTKSKLRLIVEGNFYPEDVTNSLNKINNEETNVNNNANNNINNINNNKINNELNINNININNNTEEIISENNNINITSAENNLISNDICPCENEEEEIENNIVSVDELPINPNLSMISNSNSKNIGVEPENIIQETKEEEENDENDITLDKNGNNKIGSNNTYVKILTDNEIKDFFSQQFSDNKNSNCNNKKEKENKNKLSISTNFFKNEKNGKNKNKKRNASKNNNNNKSQKNININSKKIIKAKSKSKSKSKSKENNSLSNVNKRKNYSQNIFGMIKNNKSHKNNKKENVLKNKNENEILEPCTKGKELMNNIINNLGSKKNQNENERLPTESHAKKNLLALYNQMKTKK